MNFAMFKFGKTEEEISASSCMDRLRIEPSEDGETEIQLMSSRNLGFAKVPSTSGIICRPSIGHQNLTLTLRILRGENLPLILKHPRMKVAVVDERNGFDHLNLGLTPNDKHHKNTGDGVIWGGPECKWSFDCHPSSSYLLLSMGEDMGNKWSLSPKNSSTNVDMLFFAKIPIVNLLYFRGNQMKKTRNPNTWVDFPILEDDPNSGGRVEVRLTREAVATVHDQETCKKLVAGPALRHANHESIRSSYAIRKKALYSCAPVFLNVYDVSNDPRIQKINNTTKRLGCGGIFHAGVEIYGREYSFGGSRDPRAVNISGVFASMPKQCPMHQYRESVYLGDCELLPGHVQAILNYLKPLWLAHSYDLFRKNCCFFSREFAIELGVGDIPEYVYGLAQTAESVEPYLMKLNAYLAKQTKTQPKPAGSPSHQNTIPSSTSSDSNSVSDEKARLEAHALAKDVQEAMLDHAMASRIQAKVRASVRLMRNRQQLRAKEAGIPLSIKE